MGAAVSTSWATLVSWSWPFPTLLSMHFPKAVRRCSGEIVLGSYDNFTRLSMNIDLQYQPLDQELSICHHAQKNLLTLP